MDLTKFDKQKQLFTPQQRIEGTKQSDMKGAESSHSSEYQKSEKNNKMDHSQFFTTCDDGGIQMEKQQ